MDIDKYRKQIDETDRQIVELFERRMNTVKLIAGYKAQTDTPLYDPERERSLINRAASGCPPELDMYTRVLFSTLTNLSRSYQRELYFADNVLSDTITSAIDSTDRLFPTRAAVACQGAEGAYSQQACEKIFKSPDIMYFNSFEAVFKAVDSGLCRYGVLPLENSSAGSVNAVYDLMSNYSFFIVRSVRCRVRHCLLGCPGTTLESVTEVYSHEQALSQCSDFFAQHKDIRRIPCGNTAEAAAEVKRVGNHCAAAIASPECAAIYGLSVISTDVRNSDANDTRFICISKKLEVYPGSDRTSIKLTLQHRPGALYHILARFFASDINIVKLESRPIAGSDFEFMFYFDIAESVYSPRLVSVLSDISAQTESFEYLGSYSEL